MSLPEVAITGLGVVAPGAVGCEAFAALLREGRRMGAVLADDDWPDLPAPRRAAVVRGFDPVWPRSAAKVLRGAARPLALVAAAALEAAAQAGVPADDPEGRLAVVVGGSNLTLGQSLDNARRVAAGGSPAARHGYEVFDTHVMASLAAVLGARGPGFTIGGAAAAGAVALMAGFDLIRAGRADRCVVAAPPTVLGAAEWQALSLIGALAWGESRPFDAASTGFMPGEGAAAVVLERTDRCAGPVLARLLSAEMRLGGSALPTPSADDEARVMRAALAAAGCAPGDIDLISAHATGTAAGDAAEAAAILEVFGPHGPPVNALKGLIGHGLSSAALVEVVAAVLQMRGGFVHSNPWLDGAVGGLPYVGKAAQVLPVGRVLKTAFGFGGIDCALVLGGVE